MITRQHPLPCTLPELRWRFDYPLVLGVIATACFLLHRGFKRNGRL